VQEAQLQQHKQALAELEQSQTHSEWQQIQAIISHEQQMQERVGALRTAEQRLKTWKITLCDYRRKSVM